MSLDQMNVSSRLTILLAAMVILTVAIGIVGLLGIQEANKGLNTVYKDRV